MKCFIYDLAESIVREGVSLTSEQITPERPSEDVTFDVAELKREKARLGMFDKESLQ